jgi:hypothetical protein
MREQESRFDHSLDVGWEAARDAVSQTLIRSMIKPRMRMCAIATEYFWKTIE